MIAISLTQSLHEPGTDRYVPGVCNIGTAEIGRRRRSGWFGLALSVLVLALLILIDADRAWYLTLFVPATMAASGFLQAYFRFCVGFGMSSLFNFGAVGQTTAIKDAESQARDRRMAWRILGYSAMTGLAAAAAAFAFAA